MLKSFARASDGISRKLPRGLRHDPGSQAWALGGQALRGGQSSEPGWIPVLRQQAEQLCVPLLNALLRELCCAECVRC